MSFRFATFRALTLGVVLGLLLSGCSVRIPFREDLETAIPAALLESDLGITNAEANNGVDGLAITISVTITVAKSSITPEELRQVLQVIVDNTNLTRVTYVKVGALDGTAPPHTHIDLGAVGEELGFAPSTILPPYFNADWDDVLAVINP
jgi:hypothetical protein